MKRLLLLFVCLNGVLLGKARYFNSLFIEPRSGAVVKTNTPLIVGLVRDQKNHPVRKELIMVCCDSKPWALVTTDEHGIFRYTVKATRPLSDGVHSLSALTLKGGLALQESFIAVDTTQGIVDQSAILYPAYDVTQSPTPAIVGMIRVQDEPVAEDKVTIFVDGKLYADIFTDATGIFSYVPRSRQALTEGEHTIIATSQEVGALPATTVIIDRRSPQAPIIQYPDPEMVINASEVTILGSSEPYGQVFVFFDDNTYAEIIEADSNGSWSVDVILDAGDHSVIAQVVDQAGNESPFSEPIYFYIES